MFAIGFADGCVVGGNRIGASSMAWVQFWKGRRALAHGQLRSEHVNKIEQGQQGSSRSEAVFCRFPAPVGREAVEEDHLGCAVTAILEECFARHGCWQRPSQN
jgi:hypothetical protein